MVYNFLLFVHCSACLLMIFVVLLQTGRGAGLQMFGGGGDSLIQTPTGSSFMKNFTTVLAGTFAFTSLFLTLLSSRAGLTSVTSKERMPQAPAAGPAVPANADAIPTAPPGSEPVKAPAATPAKPAKSQKQK